MPTVKTRVVSILHMSKQNVFSFHDFYNFFIIKHSKARPGLKTTLSRHFNPSECFMLFPNDNIHLHCVSVVYNYCSHHGFLSLWFYAVLVIQFHIFLISLRNVLGVFWLKMSLLLFVIHLSKFLFNDQFKCGKI